MPRAVKMRTTNENSETIPLLCEKRLAIFPSPAGMSLTKLSLAGNYLPVFKVFRNNILPLFCYRLILHWVLQTITTLQLSMYSGLIDVSSGLKASNPAFFRPVADQKFR